MRNYCEPLTNKLLKYIAYGGGIFILSLLAPQLPHRLLKAYIRHKKFEKHKVKRTIQQLQNQKLIEVIEKDDKLILKITKRGETRIRKFELDKMRIKIPKVWDKLWRLVIFDIPNYKNLARDVLRSKLKELGFKIYQKSVFIHPYDCRDEIELIKSIYKVQPHVKYIEAKSIDHQELFKKKFNLS